METLFEPTLKEMREALDKAAKAEAPDETLADLARVSEGLAALDEAARKQADEAQEAIKERVRPALERARAAMVEASELLETCENAILTVTGRLYDLLEARKLLVKTFSTAQAGADMHAHSFGGPKPPDLSAGVLGLGGYMRQQAEMVMGFYQQAREIVQHRPVALEDIRDIRAGGEKALKAKVNAEVALLK